MCDRKIVYKDRGYPSIVDMDKRFEMTTKKDDGENKYVECRCTQCNARWTEYEICPSCDMTGDNEPKAQQNDANAPDTHLVGSTYAQRRRESPISEAECLEVSNQPLEEMNTYTSTNAYERGEQVRMPCYCRHCKGEEQKKDCYQERAISAKQMIKNLEKCIKSMNNDDFLILEDQAAMIKRQREKINKLRLEANSLSESLKMWQDAYDNIADKIDKIRNVL